MRLRAVRAFVDARVSGVLFSPSVCVCACVCTGAPARACVRDHVRLRDVRA